MSAGLLAAEIAISGGGPAGMAAAAVLAAAGREVLLVDPAPPVTGENAAGADRRTTAFLHPARALLEAAGLWERLAPHAAPLRVMRIVEAAADGAGPALVRDFVSDEISDEPFGWNVPNWLLRREMAARLAEMQGVRFLSGVGTRSVLTRTGAALVGLTDGRRIEAGLLVAADGRDSPVRAAVGIGVRRLSYGQKALAFAVTHPIPHEGVSTEIHAAGGPFTLVPLPDREGRPCSAVVWMDAGPEVLRRAALPAEAFEAEASARSGHLFGPLALAGPRQVWPIVSQWAARMTAERVALVAEAAHVVPPIGAQGLNMSLADVAALARLIAGAADPGAPAVLDAYHRARHAEVCARVAGIDLLNRAAIAGSRPARDLRAAGLRALHGARPLRHAALRAGLGAGVVSGA
ncbi:MAG: FAD-dependent monooxygenase, partial [Rhodobacteraceae bacterium]|nr:FAD-dependent monooxygenase [Paracoccaceae bacterium]